MPKGYGYDKAPKKNAAFKMKGFSYAGDSPMKGKRKQIELQAAADRKYDAMDSVNSAMGEMSPMKLGNLHLDTGWTAPTAPEVKTYEMDSKQIENRPIATKEPTPNTTTTTTTGPKKSFGESFKAAMSTEIGQAAGKALVEGVINLGVGALANRKKKEPKKRVNPATAFSQMNLTRKRS